MICDTNFTDPPTTQTLENNGRVCHSQNHDDDDNHENDIHISMLL